MVFAGKGSTLQSCIQLKQGGTLPLARKGKLRYLQVAFPQMDKAMTSVTSKEMHNKCGHMSFKRMCHMAKAGLLGKFGPKDSQPFFCDACVQGKFKTAKFPKQSASRSKVPFQRICMDICGPLSKPVGSAGA